MNKILKFTLACLVGFSSLFSIEIPTHPYQDIFVNGKVLAKGEGPDCESRYNAIKKVLKQYKRPITVLDIGAAEGYFSFRTATDYDACVVMIGDPAWNDNILQKQCLANTDLDKVVLISKKITVDELQRLSECEHFDVVLALNVIHHFGTDWKKGYNAILNMGDNIIIETPPNGDRGACGQGLIEPINKCLDKEPYTLLGKFKRHTDQKVVDRLVWISKKRTELKRKDYISAESLHTFSINSTFKKKSLKKYLNGNLVSEQPWIPGINLITFKSLNGTYPTRDMLVEAVLPLTSTPSTDWFPHNVIVSGKNLHLIDTNDPLHEGTSTWTFNADLYGLMLDVIYANSDQEILELYTAFILAHTEV